MEFLISGQVIGSKSKWWQHLRAGELVPVPPTGKPEPMACMCAGEHPHRPTDYVGCGAYWELMVNRND